MLTLPTIRSLRAALIAAVKLTRGDGFPGFGPKSRDVGGAETRRGVGSADIMRIATELSSRSASCSERQ
jgi:hypothetical protein